jgi:hypothetical protein
MGNTPVGAYQADLLPNIGPKVMCEWVLIDQIPLLKNPGASE